MALSEFIRAHKEEILDEWENFVRTFLPVAEGMGARELRNHAGAILLAIATDIESAQTERQRAEKSRGQEGSSMLGGLGAEHATARAESGFSLIQLVAEYRAVRASVVHLWARSHPRISVETEREELTRFNEAIDQALTESVKRHSDQAAHVRDLFLGMLGHDLRNPLASITVSATVLLRSENLETRDYRAAARILDSTGRMERMVRDLLDLTRSRLGSGIPIFPRETNLSLVAHRVVEEISATHPERTLTLDAKGDLQGLWDCDRLEQVLSNLLGNAVQHGAGEKPITIRLRDEGTSVSLAVHNFGRPIPPETQRTLFEPMSRGQSANNGPGTTSLGLGMYISREIVLAHGGQINVTSSMEAGTTFTLTLPRSSRGARTAK